MDSFFSNLIFLLSITSIAFIAGYIFHFLLSKKERKQSIEDFKNLAKKESQLNSDYQILLEAMEGAKAQAEDMQRKLYGSNVIVAHEIQDAPTILNRQKLVRFVHHKMMETSAETPEASHPKSCSKPEALESLKALDPEVVNILSEVINP